MSTQIVERILRALAYADIFEYPLTELEIYSQVVDEGFSFVDFLEILRNDSKINQLLETKNGFWFFKGRTELINTREERYGHSLTKLKIAQRGVKLLTWVPFIKFISISNSLAWYNAKKDADIDLFISIKDGRLFFTRFLITFILSIFGLRRYGVNISDKLCLSFYITPKEYDLSNVKIIEDDIYLAYWISQVLPIYNFQEFEKFGLSNLWVRKFIAQYKPKDSSNRVIVVDSYVSLVFKRFFELIFSGFVGDFFEKIFKFIQMRKFSLNTRSLSRYNDTRVVISDSMLKFHESDRRLYYRDKFIEKLKEKNISYE